jgi:hypothetical protein
MADKVDSTTNPGSEPSGLDRRDFLRVGAASVASFTLDATTDASAARPQPGSPPARRKGPCASESRPVVQIAHGKQASS